MHDAEERKKNLHVKILDLLDHHLHGRINVESPSVGPVRSQGRIHITYADHPCSKRDRFPGKVIRISGPVIVFVMMKHCFQNKFRIALLFESLISERGVHPHIFQFFYNELIFFLPVNIPLQP